MDEQLTPDPCPEVDLDAMLDAIKTRTQAKFPALKTVEDYFRIKEKISVPAIAFEIAGIESDHIGDAGTGQFSANITLSAYCIVSYKADSGQKAKRRAASLAAAFIAFLNNEVWGCPVQLADEINAFPDVFAHHGKVAEYEVYRVDWSHRGFLGANIWSDEAQGAVIAEEIYLGQAPNIGPDHVDDYRRVYDKPEVGPV